MMALLQSKDAKYDPIIESARRFLINQQSDFDQKGKEDNIFDGGVGYGSRWAHSDLFQYPSCNGGFVLRQKVISVQGRRKFRFGLGCCNFICE